ncbi:MAG: hypothetical protein AB1733_16675 [Thermodesulfobacteriota bacterium]
MTIFALSRPLSRVLGIPGQVESETTCRNLRSSARRPSSFRTLSCWALILSVSLLMLSACGRHKEELESANQQIDKLTSEVKRLTEQIARLNKEKSSLAEEAKSLSDENTRIQRELDHLSKSHAALSSENKELKKKAGLAEEEIASLKREKVRLTQEVDDLKKRPDALPQPLYSPAPVPKEASPPSAKQQQELTPCDHVLAFMKASEGIVRTQKGQERAKALEQVRKEYAPRMEGAPEKAIRAAEEWVKQGAKWWDGSDSDSSFRLLELRNTALETCGKSPKETGF